MTAHAGRKDQHPHLDHMGFGEQDPHEARSNMLLGVKLGILSVVMLFGAIFAA